MKLPEDIVREENVTYSEYQTSSVATAQADSTTNSWYYIL